MLRGTSVAVFYTLSCRQLEEMQEMIKRKALSVGLALAFAYLILAVSTLPGTGIVWDETRYFAAAKARAYSIYSAVSGAPGISICSLDFEAQSRDDIGRCWDGRARLSQTLSGLTWAGIWFLNGRQLDLVPSISAHRISTILLTMAGVFVLFLFASELFGTMAGVFSSLALIFMPRFFAQSHYATLDVPVAVMVLLTLYFFWKGLGSWKFGLLTGIVFGLALATKVNAYFIPFIIAAWLLVSYRDRALEILNSIKNRAFEARPIPLVFFSLIFLSPLMLVLAWPWIWVNTIPRFMAYLVPTAANTEFFGYGVYYMGGFYADAPWHYPWVMTSITLTVPILIFSILGAIKSARDTASYRNRASFLILLAALVPLLVFSLPLASPYSGTQLFMPAFPFIAMLAGAGAGWVFGSAEKRLTGAGARGLMLAVLTLLLIMPGLHAVSRGNPYSANYYNEIIGGPKGAYEGGFELEYNGEAYLDLIPWLNRNMGENASLYVPYAWNILNTYKYGDIGQIAERASEGRHGLDSSILDQFGASVSEQKTLLRGDLNILSSPGGADYTILMLRMSSIKNAPGLEEYLEACEPIHTEAIGGAPAINVYEAGCL